MPITKSAKKALRRDKRKREVNNRVRNRAKEAVKSLKKSLTTENMAKTASCLDRAVKKNLIHKNKAARMKSRLAKLVNKTAPKTKAKKA